MTEATLLNQLTRIVARAPSQAPLTERLLRAFVTMTGVDGGAVSVGVDTAVRTGLAFTDQLAERFEDLQEVLREGPALDAMRTGLPVGLDDVVIQDRWPMLHQSMRDSPQRPVEWLAAVPMRPYAEVLGVITLYRARPGATSLGQRDLTFLADAIGAVILGGFDRSDEGNLLWSVSDRIDQATGMVIAQLHLRPSDALALLRAHAFAAGTALSTVADAVVSRRLDFRERTHEEGSTS